LKTDINSKARSGRIYIPTQKAEDWKKLLADPDKQWRKGYSAATFAYCWQDSDGFPAEIDRLFKNSEVPSFRSVELLLAIPEHKVMLPGGQRASQNDLFALAKGNDGQLISITIEGKVTESFGPTLEEWENKASDGKIERLKYIKRKIGIEKDFPSNIRYQLLHRAASAVIEAEKFNAKSAVMIVHSFGESNDNFMDYSNFVGLYGKEARKNEIMLLTENNSIAMYAGWAMGNPKYLNYPEE
jgi:hypothetical protein